MAIKDLAAPRVDTTATAQMIDSVNKGAAAMRGDTATAPTE